MNYQKYFKLTKPLLLCFFRLFPRLDEFLPSGFTRPRPALPSGRSRERRSFVSRLLVGFFLLRIRPIRFGIRLGKVIEVISTTTTTRLVVVGDKKNKSLQSRGQLVDASTTTTAIRRRRRRRHLEEKRERTLSRFFVDDI